MFVFKKNPELNNSAKLHTEQLLWRKSAVQGTNSNTKWKIQSISNGSALCLVPHSGRYSALWFFCSFPICYFAKKKKYLWWKKKRIYLV